jgi:hypothetical protein
MNAATKAALAMLRSPDFFAHLRSALAREGLAGEEKFGVAIYFVMISRFRPNPLRVALVESTDGGAEYMVRRVSRLFEPGTICGVCPEHRWLRFAENPTQKVVYVRQWSDKLREGIRFEIDGNKLARVSLRDRDGRIIAMRDPVEESFACIAEQYPWESFDRSRWLTVELPTPLVSVRTGMMALSDDEIATWREVQSLLQERAKRTVVLPDWGDVLVEQISESERGARHLPFFVRAWQTMTMLRSFEKDDLDNTYGQRNVLQADFEDLAITSLLLRSVAKEGRWFPSPKSVFKEVFPVGEDRGVINPLTGKGVRYIRRDDKPAQGEYVLLV